MINHRAHGCTQWHPNLRALIVVVASLGYVVCCCDDHYARAHCTPRDVRPRSCEAAKRYRTRVKFVTLAILEVLHSVHDNIAIKFFRNTVSDAFQAYDDRSEY